MTIRILIADDSQAIREAVRYSLQNNPQFQVCGEAEDGRDAITAARRLRPDVIILDVSMPRMSGLDAARELVSLVPKPAIVLFTAHSEEDLPQDIYRLGIRSVISKNDSRVFERLRAGVREAMEPEHFAA